MIKETDPTDMHDEDIPFFPDKFQFDLIQHIKNDESVLVVIPTSGGFFILFYFIYTFHLYD